jgi:electron transport complex protein RnfC
MGLAINNVKTFPMGGVHPAENKFTADKPVEKMEVPKQVSIPISQHIGAPAKPVVEQREKVKVGQVIATSAGFVSANIHATIAGTVAKIDKVMGFYRI